MLVVHSSKQNIWDVLDDGKLLATVEYDGMSFNYKFRSETLEVSRTKIIDMIRKAELSNTHCYSGL